MPQLDTTYFISQLFWLAVLFTLFYLSIRFLVVPMLQSIISARSHFKDESYSFVGMVDLEIAKMKIEAKDKALATTEFIKKLEEATDLKYDIYCKDLQSKLQKKLDHALEEAEKEVGEFTRKTLAEEKMNELVIQSAKHMIYKLTNIDIPDTELKNLIKS